MSVVFAPYASRGTVAAMLEAPVRRMRAIGAAYDQDVEAIIAELDRMDAVREAQLAATRHRAAWEAAVLAQDIVIADAPAGTKCHLRSYPRGTWRREDGKEHAAKVTLNGVGYCRTHLTRAKEHAEYTAIAKHRDEYVPNPAIEVILNADRDLYRKRKEAEKNRVASNA